MALPAHDRFSLTGAPEQHLLAGPVSAQTLSEHLPGGTPIEALRQITKWLGEIVTLTECPLQHWLDVIDLLDRLAHNHQLHLVPPYLDAHRMRKLSESQLWLTTFGYWQALGDAYGRCLLRYQAAPDDARDFRPQLPVVIGRQLRSLALQLKWTLLRYARVEDRIWRDLGQGHMLAESWGIANRRCAIYPNRLGESPPQQELLKALMLAMAAPDALTPVQQHIAERLAAHFSPSFSLHTTAGPGCVFSFDMSMHQPPARVRSGTTPAPLRRFFGQGTSSEGLHALLAQVRQHGMLLTDIGLGGEYDRADILATLQHLSRHWSDLRPDRRSPREPTMMRLTVVPGLVSTARWMARLRQAGGREVPPPAQSESWVVFDASGDGCGAVLPPRPADWLMVGTLMGVRSESAPAIRMAILRRITADTDDYHSVGIEFIGEHASSVALHPESPRLEPGKAPTGQAAILLSRKPDEQGAIELLLQPNGLSKARALQMQLHDKIYWIEFLRLIEQGQHYLHMSYRLRTPD